ncbi:MAG: beta-lactamase family protein [Gemmatimonadota bacterium]|nr:beta-lactamase family protein [Gemmatimonadota bacterium]
MLVGAPILALSCVIGCADGDRRIDVSRPSDSPAASQLDSVLLDSAYARAARLPRLRSLIVQWKGNVVRERYYGGATRERRSNIKSASKSVMSALVGIAIAKGHVRGLDQTIGELLPRETAGLDERKRAITVGNLLSMRSGLQSTSFDNYGAWVSSRNWIQYALSRPMVAEPGGPMQYSTASSHLLSAIITRASGMSTYSFAQRYLAAPLGIELRPWQRDPQGIFFGGNDLYLTPRDMLKIGQLYLDRGTAGGREIIPPQWVDSSLVPRTVSPFNGNGYGYGWWTRRTRGIPVHYAWGYGGQFIFVVPALELVVVATSDAQAEREWGHTRELHRIVEQDIAGAVGRPSER